jgi:hypothetical protein
MVATYATATAGDRIIQYLMGSDARRVSLTSEPGASPGRPTEPSDLDRFEG